MRPTVYDSQTLASWLAAVKEKYPGAEFTVEDKATAQETTARINGAEVGHFYRSLKRSPDFPGTGYIR